MKRMNKQVYLLGVVLLVLAVIIVGCGPAVSDPEQDVEATEETQAETDEPASTQAATDQPTNTPRPTETPEPAATKTPRPANTPRPTATTSPTTSAPQATQPRPTAIPPTQQPTATLESSGEFVPPGESVWVLDRTASETGSSAECPEPFYTDFYGLVLIQTIDNGITWQRAQDGITYTLLRQSPNVYWGTGQSIYPNYTLTISVLFTSPTGFGVTFVLIDQTIPGCNHYWRYGGTLR